MWNVKKWLWNWLRPGYYPRKDALDCGYLPMRWLAKWQRTNGGV